MVCYWDELLTPIGPLYMAATEEGLIYCSTPNGEKDKMLDWFEKFLPSYNLKKGENGIVISAKEQLSAYFLRKNKILSVPMKLIGTPFQIKVWKALTTIPYGETKTYGEIASYLGNPKGSRAVGGANNKNPVALFVP